MELTWYGRTCVRLRGKDAVLVADPYQTRRRADRPRDHRRHRHVQPPDDTPLAGQGQGQAVPRRHDAAALEPRRGVRPRRPRRVRGQGGPRHRRSDLPRRRQGRGARQAACVRRRARRHPHDPPRRDRPPAVGGEARRHRPGRHRLRAARRRAQPDQGGGARRPARPEDRRPDAAVRGRGGLQRGARRSSSTRWAPSPSRSPSCRSPPRACPPRRRPSCWSRAASRPDRAAGTRRVRRLLRSRTTRPRLITVRTRSAPGRVRDLGRRRHPPDHEVGRLARARANRSRPRARAPAPR